MRLHTGTDILATDSLLVKSCGSGTVTGIDTDTIMGTVITVDHGNGIYIRYCGIKNVNVNVGDTVTVESSIGEIGTVTSECAEQAHLHLEVIKDGNPIDPAVLIPFN
jgi:stage II sporulation protein Q